MASKSLNAMTAVASMFTTASAAAVPPVMFGANGPTFAGAAVTGGGGSSKVDPLYTVSPLQGLQNVLRQLGSNATVNQVIVNNDNSNLAAATQAAASADVTIVMAGVVTSEGSDRPSLSLPNNQDALISAVAAANPHTVLVLEAWYPGEEDGNIVANLLFGLDNPSGKLPVTYPASAAETPTSTPAQYPGTTVNGAPTVFYSEGLEMGYRWYTTNGVKPLFPFGYGLSYTTFALNNLTYPQGAGEPSIQLRDSSANLPLQAPVTVGTKAQ